MPERRKNMTDTEYFAFLVGMQDKLIEITDRFCCF